MDPQEAAGGAEVLPVRNRTTTATGFAWRTVRGRQTVRPSLREKKSCERGEGERKLRDGWKVGRGSVVRNRIREVESSVGAICPNLVGP